MFKVFSNKIAEAFVDASLLFSVHTGCIAYNKVHFPIFPPQVSSIIAWKTVSLLTEISWRMRCGPNHSFYFVLNLYTKTVQICNPLVILPF